MATWIRCIWKSLTALLLLGVWFPSGARAQQTLRFTARFADPQGYQDIHRAMVVLGSERCQVEVYPASNEFDLLDGPGGVRTAMATPGSDATLTGEACSISAAGSSIDGAGEELRIAVMVTFPDLLSARRPFTATALGAASAAAVTPISTWIDPSPVRGEGLAPLVERAQADGACQYNFPVWPGFVGSGPASTFLIWSTGAGCQGSATSSVSWITMGTPGVSGNYNFLPVSIAENDTGQHRYGAITFSGTGFSQVFTTEQGVPNDFVPNLVWISPASGTGTSQVFALQVYEGTGYRGVGTVNLQFAGADGATCNVTVDPNFYAGNPYVALYPDSEAFSAPLTLPSIESLRNSVCSVNGAESGVSGSGDLVNVQLSMSFSQAFAGARYASGYAVEAGSYNPGVYAMWVVPLDPTAPALRITKTHTGNFTQSQTNATYTVTVSNLAGAAPSSGTVTVTDTLPAGLTLVSMAGTGWNCNGATCSRGDPLAAGASYPSITVTVNVAANFGGGTNQVSLSGGGSIPLTAYDGTLANPNPPVLSVSSAHTANFTQAQTNATYNIVVSNQVGTDPTTGWATITDTLPAGLTLVSMAGTGWTCTVAYASCSRSDPLAAGNSYPPITVTVNVSITAASPLVNSVSVSGGGSASASATDSTIVAPHGLAITIQASLAGAPFSLEDGSVYQAPTTLYWPAGAQHTLTWLTAVPGQSNALYSFQSWSDGGPNPRTFTATAAATYTANVQVQFLLTVTIPNGVGGTVTASPASADGFYAAGQAVTLTASAAPGMSFNGFTGDFTAYSPLSITMNAPHTVTANFGCADTYTGIPPSQIGPGPITGFILTAANAACAVPAVTSTAPWLVMGTPTVLGGYNAFPYSLAANTGSASRTAGITVSNGAGPPVQYNITQNASGCSSSQSNLASVSPSGGAGLSQVFNFQAYDPAGCTQSDALSLAFGSTNCQIVVNGLSTGIPQVSLLADTGGYRQMALPGTGSLQNSACTLDVGASSVSVSGNLANIQVALTFAGAEAGAQSIYDASRYTVLGVWTVPADPSVPALSVAQMYSSQLAPPGQTHLPVTVTVSNAVGAAATSGTVTVTETMPSGLVLASMTGNGWTCGGNACTRTDPLAAGVSYPPIAVAINVGTTASSWQYYVSTVSGGGSASFSAPGAVAVISPPVLSVGCSPNGNFLVGQTDASYGIQVRNQAYTVATSGKVTVTEYLPAGLSLVSMSGDGWSCTGTSCSRSDPLANGQVFPLIAVIVSVATTAGSPLVNQVTVSGGGSADASTTVSTIVVSNPAVLSISLTHTGSFYNQQSGTFTAVVSNQAGALATSGTVTVTDIAPPGMGISLAGDGWSCVSSFYECNRSDVLAGGSSYPPITITAEIAVSGSTQTLLNQVTVKGGESLNASASDTVTILPAGTLNVTVSHNGNFTQAQTNATYTITVSNPAGGGSVSGAYINEGLPTGLTLVSITGTGWTCTAYGNCSRNDSLAAGSSYPQITVTVNVAVNAGSPLVNSVGVSGGFNPTGGTDSTVILPHAATVIIQANIAGAPFSLEDGSTYQAPATFYWAGGVQHTVTWLSATPGQTNARYTFQGWYDGVGGNPRTFAGGTAANYTANIAAQYQVSLSASPATEGTVSISPSSSDGFYSAGQSATVTATPNAGFQFTGFTNEYYGIGSPWTFTVAAPQAIVANFGCKYTFYGRQPYGSGPGPLSALYLWTSGPGCTLTASSNAAWLTIGPSYVSDGFNAFPFTAPANSGAQQSAGVSLSGTDLGTENSSFGQDAASSTTPGPVSVTPNHGSGIGQVFTLQAYDSADYANIGELDLTVTGMDGSECRAAVTSAGGPGSLYLLGDSGIFLPPLDLPGTGTLQNSRCSLSAAGSSVSGSGSLLTANFDLTFTTAFLGSKYVAGTAKDTTGTIGGTNVLGTWQVSQQPAAPILLSPAGLSGNVPLAPSLQWDAAPGATSYDVYFGTSATPPYVGSTPSATYSPGSLNPGSTYYWQVVANNSSGSGTSTTMSFTTVQPCTANVTAASPYSFAAAANGATVTVAAAGCSWGYTSPVAWVSLQPAGGLASGNGSVAISLPANNSPTPRSATITVAGVNLAIAQDINHACDPNGDDQISVADVQLMINEALGLAPAVNDLNQDGTVNITDVQTVINAVLGLGCAVP